MSVSAPELLLELKQLSCERDLRPLFENLNGRFCAGEVVQIVGPNGSGKTSLIRLLTGISNDCAGEIRFCGKPLAEIEYEYRQNLLYIGHQSAVKKALSPRENLNWWLGLNPGHGRITVDQALAEIGLTGFEDRPCYSLSAGQQRRVALAKLYLTPALIWILDEPYTAIDVAGVERLEAVIAEHAAGGGLVIMTSHQAPDVAGLKRLNLADFSPKPFDDGELLAAFSRAAGSTGDTDVNQQGDLDA